MKNTYTIILTGKFDHNNSNTKKNILNIINNPLIKEIIVMSNHSDFEKYRKIINIKLKIIKLKKKDYSIIPSDIRSIFIQADQIMQAVKYVSTKYVIRLRSDILLKKLDKLFDEFSSNKEKICIFPGTPNLIRGGYIYSINDYFFICKVSFLKLIWDIPKNKKIIECDLKYILIFLFISRSGYGGEFFFPEQILFRTYLYNKYSLLKKSCIDDLSLENTYHYEKIFSRDFHALRFEYFDLPLKLKYRNYDEQIWLYPNDIKFTSKYSYLFRYIIIIIKNLSVSILRLSFFKKFLYLSNKLIKNIRSH